MLSNSLIAIFGMALVTYMVRAGGLWLMGFVKPSPWVEAWLKALPGAVIVSLVAPTVLASSLPETLAALATVLVAARTKKLFLAIVVGVGVVWMLRRFL
ncbi:AzlD domain-containing protein [Ktedonosporobacter rubrisoli]|uniref:AzlD domain-containing protein n=1 Tax=Ktedonosporobacter rubrisoli TaxID=2509675 RepID=A0A4P6JM25_KTERU|nr:AzlD domain-containing protein [Ktedonosporobacter rubrisoli]QBD76288.1 AzlD domain-containing protein [Ktedonosporobacter rubrisoli]